MLAISAEILAAECAQIARRHVEHYGHKRGLYLFGRAIQAERPERRARAIYAGEARRIEAHEYLLARRADIALRREIRAQLTDRLRQINAELEGINDESSSVGGGEAVDMARVVA